MVPNFKISQSEFSIRLLTSVHLQPYLYQQLVSYNTSYTMIAQPQTTCKDELTR